MKTFFLIVAIVAIIHCETITLPNSNSVEVNTLEKVGEFFNTYSKAGNLNAFFNT
jgi:hypothetical protein